MRSELPPVLTEAYVVSTENQTHNPEILPRSRLVLNLAIFIAFLASYFRVNAGLEALHYFSFRHLKKLFIVKFVFFISR
jgi:hypothetical protein